MLYEDELITKTKIIRPLVQHFAEIAYKNQTHHQDFFLILINAYYLEELEKPYVFGTDWSIIGDKSFSAYIKWYTTNPTFKKNTKEKLDYTSPDFELYKISTHTEKSIYLRYWEADTTLQYLYQMVRLCNGLHFDWKWKQKIGEYRNRQEFFRKEIRNPIKNIDKDIYDFFKTTTIAQIRNAIAHSQYCLLNNEIKYLNYSKDAQKYSSLMLLSYEDWADIIHNTLVFRNELIHVFNKMNKGYIELKTKSPLELRITKEGDNVEFGQYNR